MTPNRTLDDRDHEIIASRKEGLSVPQIADRLGATQGAMTPSDFGARERAA